jgi:hypothetical protein
MFFSSAGLGGTAVACLLLLLAIVTNGQNTIAPNGRNTTEIDFNRRRTLSIGIVCSPRFFHTATSDMLIHTPRQVVFPGFEPLDVFGPLEIFFSVRALRLSSYSRSGVGLT